MEINDIVTFWKTINNVPKIYEIFSDGKNIKKLKRNNCTPCAYSFFRKNISPCWEDIKNKNGFELSVKNSWNFTKFHDEWINSIIELISNREDIYKHINGIRIVDCTKFDSVLYRMEFWVDSEDYKEDIEKILNSESFGFRKYKFLYRSHSNVKETI
tara:strand:+ start:788 stop:1258 length:471 start_codon:yes stop_codon:yes gene_type:complete